MATATAERPTIQETGRREIIAQAREVAGESTREIAETCISLASEELNREAMIEGWQDRVRHYDADWSEPKLVRSGHNNASGRFRNLGILSQYGRLNDGNGYPLGEFTVELLDQWAHEFGEREKANSKGRKFAQACKREMQKAAVSILSDLGEERVEALRKQHDFRPDSHNV